MGARRGLEDRQREVLSLAGRRGEVILASTTMLISRISATVQASLISITSAPRRAGMTVSAVANASSTSVTANGTHCGGFATPIALSSELKNTAAP